jgi:hypothetical protein
MGETLLSDRYLSIWFALSRCAGMMVLKLDYWYVIALAVGLGGHLVSGC